MTCALGRPEENFHLLTFINYCDIIIIKGGGDINENRIQSQNLSKQRTRRNLELTLKDRVYKCSCGLELDRDIIAACNIVARGFC